MTDWKSTKNVQNKNYEKLYPNFNKNTTKTKTLQLFLSKTWLNILFFFWYFPASQKRTSSIVSSLFTHCLNIFWEWRGPPNSYSFLYHEETCKCYHNVNLLEETSKFEKLNNTFSHRDKSKNTNEMLLNFKRSVNHNICKWNHNSHI